MKDLALRVDDRPGAAAEVFEALGQAGVSVEGGCGLADPDGAMVHVLVADEASAVAALSAAGHSPESAHEALVVAVEDAPGAAGRLLREVAAAGVNLAAVYLATNTRLVLTGSNLDAARTRLQAGLGDPEATT